MSWMLYFCIQSQIIIQNIFICLIIISIRKLIDNSIIPNQLHAENFTPVAGAKLFAVFL